MIEGLSEVILYVKDMDSQVGFYRDVLHLKVAYPAGAQSFKGQKSVLLDSGGGCQLALRSCSKRQAAAESPHFVFSVGDIRASREVLSLMGVPVGEIREIAPGVELLEAIDPEGNAFGLQHRAV